MSLSTLVSPTRKEAISRSVILALALLHEVHQLDPRPRSEFRSVLSDACQQLCQWTAHSIDQSAHMLDDVLTCEHPTCLTASKKGPKGIYDTLEQEKVLNSDECVAFCTVGQDILRFGSVGDLRQKWRLIKWAKAIKNPTEARVILSNTDLQRIDGSFAPSFMFEQHDELFTANERFKTVAQWLKVFINHITHVDKQTSSISFSSDRPYGNTLQSLDTSKISGAAWGQTEGNYSYP